MPQPSVFKGVQDFPLPAFKPLIPSAGLSKATLAASRRPFQGNSRPQEPVPVIHRFSWTFCSGTCHLLFLHGFPACFKPFRRPFQGNSHSYRPQPSVFKGVQLPFARLQTATGPSHLFLRAKPLKPSHKPFQGNSCSFPQAFPRQLLQLHAPDNASNPSASLSTATLAATGPSHLLLRTFKTAVCPPSNPSNPPAGLSKATLAASRKHFQSNSCSYMAQTMLQTLPQAFPK